MASSLPWRDFFLNKKWQTIAMQFKTGGTKEHRNSKIYNPFPPLKYIVGRKANNNKITTTKSEKEIESIIY